MISLETKTETSASKLPLHLNSKEDSKINVSSFSELLSGASLSKFDNEVKVVQNGTLVLALETESTEIKPLQQTKKDMLLSLLSEESSIASKLPSLELNPQVSKALSPTELKELVSDAKKYLHTKILESAEFKKSEIKALPKTLKGLAKVAQKFAIEVSKITLEDVNPTKQTVSKVELALKNATTAVELKEKKTISAQKEVFPTQIESTEKKVIPKVEKSSLSELVKQDSKSLSQQEVKHPTQDKTLKAVPKRLVKGEVNVKTSKVLASLTPKKEASSKEIEPTKTTPKILSDTKLTEGTLDANTEIRSSKVKQKVETTMQNELETDEFFKKQTKERDIPVISKSTLLFKAQVSPRVTTEQLVQTKLSSISKVQATTQKSKIEDTLKVLLKGEKATKNESGFTADFSVATARVIAPQTIQKQTQTLELLLQGEQSENSHIQKSDGLNVNKTESLEVKMNEAKQMTKYLSQDVKTAIDDYKSPFTRIKVQLNPERLGAVELTVVQRGKNLHINLSSNNSAINALAMNVNDLKVQLNNNGINNATLNFNNNSQSSESGFSGQERQSQQHERDAKREYNYFDNEEANEEITNSLEIVVPNYA